MPQHKLVVADFRFRVRLQQSKRVQVSMTKCGNLKKRQQRRSRRESSRRVLGMKEGMQIACR
jgi:hypothetical protein